MGASWKPLCSHWVPLGGFRGLGGYFWSSWAPFGELLEAPWAHFEVIGCHFGCLGHLKWGLGDLLGRIIETNLFL